MHLCPLVSMLHALFYTVKSAEASLALDRVYFLSGLILVGVAFAVRSAQTDKANKTKDLRPH